MKPAHCAICKEALLVWNYCYIPVQCDLILFQICMMGLSSALKQQKQKHAMVEIDPYSLGKCSDTQPADSRTDIHPGDRPDSMWHHYDSQVVLDSQEKWDQCVLVEKTHYGYYSWPR